jgi:uncharacterized protein YdeI (YjbR/CyaY-like superfamily)
MALMRDQIFFENRNALRAWLQKNHTREYGIWAQFYKKASGLGDLGWEAIVEECLCFGWIDSLPGKVDDQRTQIYISPRKPNSGWSRRNKAVLLELERAGLITDAGRQVIERAKANGSWTRFDLAEDLVIPDDLLQILDGDQKFYTSWDALSDARKRQCLQQIYDSKTESTRANRIESLRIALLKS